jgi:hypothetical protein
VCAALLFLALAPGAVEQARAACPGGDPQAICDRPIPTGVSISTTPSLPFIFAGTGGLRVRSLFNPNIKFLLTNNHVGGAVGPVLCPDTAPVGTWWIQPGTLDLGFDPGHDPDFLVGVLAARVPIVMSTSADNRVDGAIGYTVPSLVDTEILNIGDPDAAFLQPAVGMAVTKSGRTTGVTNGTIQAVNVTSVVNYGTSCGTARFIRQVSITPGGFSAGGDSGSIILDSATHRPVALLFAGSASNTIGNSILDVYLGLRVFVDAPGAPTSVSELSAMIQSLPVDPDMARMMAIQERVQDRVLAVPGVTGIGIGQAESGGGYSFVVYRRQADPDTDRQIPRSLEGVAVRLLQSGDFAAR